MKQHLDADNFLACDRVKREELRITAWENLQKAKAEAAIRKLEVLFFSELTLDFLDYSSCIHPLYHFFLKFSGKI